jgi:hypothetical protein
VGEKEREEFVGRTLIGSGQTRWSLPVKRGPWGVGGRNGGILVVGADGRLALQLAAEERLQ